MYKIFKYRIPFKEIATVVLPKEAKIIRVDDVDGAIYLWAIVNTDPNWETEERTFYLFKTGSEMPHNIHEYTYLGCGAIYVQMELMMYIFEIPNSAKPAKPTPNVNWKEIQEK